MACTCFAERTTLAKQAAFSKKSYKTFGSGLIIVSRKSPIKQKKFHVCRKHKSDSHNYAIQSDGLAIKAVDKLWILGVLFSKNYYWKDYHYQQFKSTSIPI